MTYGRPFGITLSSVLVTGFLLFGGPASLHGATLVVNAGGDLQAALNAAQPGDTIVLQAGARFVGSFRLPPKPSGPVITIRSSATLPARRMTPDDAALLPTIASGTPDTALVGEQTANWRLDGIRFESSTTGEGHIIGLWDATNIYMDRLLIVAGSQGQKRGIMGNGQHITLTRSHIANIWRSGQDSQAFCAWDGAGPYTVTDNYLEAASENVMFGGANSKSADRVPADILVEGNHFSKRLEWKGQPRNVKNLFELKSAKRVTVRNNLFERNWTDGQNGYAILFTVRNDEGGAPWSVIEDVLFERNIVRDTEGVFNLLGYDGYQPSGQTTRITIRNNLAAGTGTFLQAGGEVGVLTLDHNTVDQAGNFAMLYYGDVWVTGASARRPARFAVESLTITNTLGNHGPYGVFGEGAGIGSVALTQLTLSRTWTHNVLAGESGWGQLYPPITWQPAMAEHKAHFNADYTLTTVSTYLKAGTDGLDLGRSWETISSTATSEPSPATSEPSPSTSEPPPSTSEPPPSTSEPAAPTSEPEPTPPAAPSDTTGPTITISNVVQNPNFYKFRVNAVDASGIAGIKVEFRGIVVATSATSPLDASILIRGMPKGSYALRITVTDTVGNATVVDRTIVR